MTVDRRVVRSRALLHQALFSLILERGYDAISIKDVCDRADVGRTTFYAHFTSKDDLKRAGLERLRDALLDRQRIAKAAAGSEANDLLTFSLPIFEHGRDHLGMYRALAGSRGGGIALGTIRDIVREIVRGNLAEGRPRGTNDLAVPNDLTVEFVAGAFMSVLSWWLDGGAELAPRRIDAIFRGLVIDGIGRPAFELTPSGCAA